LEQILGQEAMTIDEYDDRDEQADMDPGTVSKCSHIPIQNKHNVPCLWISCPCPPAGVADEQMKTSWSEEETVALVEVWAADDVQHSLKTYMRNGHVYADISEKLASLGYLRTAEQCQLRIKRLKKTYRRYCNSRRKTPWSDLETRTLLEIWGEDSVQLTLRGCLKNRHVFEYISEKLSNHGFIRTTEQCYTRMKRLKYSFVHEKEEFKFFNEMDKIFRKDLNMDDSVVNPFIVDEADDFAPEVHQMKGNHWLADSSKMAWGDGETEALLEIWGSAEIQENLKGGNKNKSIYKQISQVMASQGYLRSPEQCQSRVKRLRANFRQFLEGRQ
ncbi:hypothetical protein XENOCAPTIV_014238, partial [Xenoophorus captivus]